VPAFAKAEMPVEARDAWALLLATFGPELSDRDRKELEAAVERLQERIGSLEIVGLPHDAALRVSGRERTPGPDGVVVVAMGQHTLEVRAEGYKPWATQVTVAGQKRLLVDVRLERSALPALARVESTVEPAYVELDGGAKERLPIERALAPGAHKYRVYSDNYRSETGTFTVEPNARTMIRVPLLPDRAPLGLRIEPAYHLEFPLRTDTPFNSGYEGLDFSGGTAFSSAIGVTGMVSFDRRQSWRAGVEFLVHDRTLNRVQIGATGMLCPAALGRTDGTVRWCPLSLSYYWMLSGGQVGPFRSGQNAGSAATRVEVREGPLSLSAGAGLGVEFYQRSTTSLTLGMGSITFSLGYEL
jgi:hypothetical protein